MASVLLAIEAEQAEKERLAQEVIVGSAAATAGSEATEGSAPRG
jgi:hypothetical protein